MRHATLTSALFILLIAGAEAQHASAPASSDAIARVLHDRESAAKAYARLTYLCDHIGARLAGSRNLERAVAWSADELRSDRLDHVAIEPVQVPVWHRGNESLKMILPFKKDLHILGLGGSIGTGWRGITGDIEVVTSFDEMDSKGRAGKLAGRVVLVNAPMRTDIDPFEAYGEVYPYRAESASRAARHGARAVLVRSLTTRSMQTPHTGGMRYQDDTLRVPAAAISIEDADTLHRLVSAGSGVRVKLKMGARERGEAPSANVIAELRGSEKPDEIVLVGAHLDSWDVGCGASDDGAGVVGAMSVVHLLKKLGLTPRRTIRVVLFTNEENGMRGARSYFEKHGTEKHVAAIESDAGAGRVLGFSVSGSQAQVAHVRTLATPLESIGGNKVVEGFAGVDLIPLTDTGVLGLGLEPDPTHYFDLHHSAADTLDKVNPADLATHVTALTVMAWQLAN